MENGDEIEGDETPHDSPTHEEGTVQRLCDPMELRVSVQSLVRQLVHEQAKATVHLEGLQRDVSTLLNFRDQVLDSIPRLPDPPTDPPWKHNTAGGHMSRQSAVPPWKTRDSVYGTAEPDVTMAALRTARQQLASNNNDSNNSKPASNNADAASNSGAAAATGTHLTAATRTTTSAGGHQEEPTSPDSDGEAAMLSRTGTRWHDAGHSGASGNSTSGVGTSTSGVGTSVGAAGVSGGTTDGGGVGSEQRWAEGDELLGLLDAIATKGRRLCDENRQLAEVLSHTELDEENVIHSHAAGDVPPPGTPDHNVTFRCRYCERTLPSRTATPHDPTRLVRDPVTDALNLNVHLSGHSPLLGQSQLARDGPHQGQSPLLRGSSPHLTAQSPLFGGRAPQLGRTPPQQQQTSGACGDSPFSLPVLRPREEYISALTEVERLMQERDLLMERLLGMELVAVRSQGQAASLQTRLQMVSAANEELRRELRHASSTRSEVDARIHDMHQQFVRSRRLQPGLGSGGSAAPAGSPGPSGSTPAATATMARSTPDLRLPSRIPQPLSLRRRAFQEQPRSLSRPPGTAGNSPGSTSGASPSAKEHPRPTPLRTVHRATQTDREERVREEVGRGRELARAAVPDRAKVAEVLRETEPLRLQKQLLLMLVEAEILRAQVASLGGDPNLHLPTHRIHLSTSGLPPSTSGPPPSREPSPRGESEDASRGERGRLSQSGERARWRGGDGTNMETLQRQNDELRLQLEERQIELEGTRARLRQLETSSPASTSRTPRTSTASGSGGPASTTAGSGGKSSDGPSRRLTGTSISGSPGESSLHSSIPVLVRSSSPGRFKGRASDSKQSPSGVSGNSNNVGDTNNKGMRYVSDGLNRSGYNSARSGNSRREAVAKSGSRDGSPAYNGRYASATDLRSGPRSRTPTRATLRSGPRSRTPTRATLRSGSAHHNSGSLTPTRYGSANDLTLSRSSGNSDLATVKAMKQLNWTLRRGSVGSTSTQSPALAQPTDKNEDLTPTSDHSTTTTNNNTTKRTTTITATTQEDADFKKVRAKAIWQMWLRNDGRTS